MAELGKGKRTSLRFEKTETLILLRAYQVHPASYEDIVQTMRENSFLRPKAIRDLYETEPDKKLIQRIREKIQRLLTSENIEDEDIKQELELIKNMELANVEATLPTSPQPTLSATSASTSKQRTSSASKKTPSATVPSTSKHQPSKSASKRATPSSPVASTSKQPSNPPSDSSANDLEEDIRLRWSRKIAKKIEKIPKKKKKSAKKRPFRELVRDNEEMKNILLKRYIKRKREDSSTTSSDSDSDSDTDES